MYLEQYRRRLPLDSTHCLANFSASRPRVGPGARFLVVVMRTSASPLVDIIGPRAGELYGADAGVVQGWRRARLLREGAGSGTLARTRAGTLARSFHSRTWQPSSSHRHCLLDRRVERLPMDAGSFSTTRTSAITGHISLRNTWKGLRASPTDTSASTSRAATQDQRRRRAL